MLVVAVLGLPVAVARAGVMPAAILCWRGATASPSCPPWIGDRMEN